MTMSLIQTVTVGSGGASSIEFTSIPQDGTDLVVLFSGRDDWTNPSNTFRVQFNNSTTDYTERNLYGSGSSVASLTSSGTGVRVFAGINATASTSNTFNNCQIYVSNYTAATNKSVSADAVIENNDTQSTQQIVAGSWSNTAAITILTLQSGRTMLEHSTASLYKITKGSDGIVTTS